jgi:hypothetical protein
MADDDLQRLLEEIRAARAALPAEHRELLDLLGVQETAVDDWPDGVINLYATLRGLDPPTRRLLLHGIAWHEYGHALSVTRATREHRERGPALLLLLPEGLRETIHYPGRYRTDQVFDEVIANVYALLVGRVQGDGYSPPAYLHPAVFSAFEEVIPWPQTP